ncbi:SURF1 family protein [Aestuariibacter salexigens]|uniref:SURF1 family protein n=1 Tax=Aestuariibacter salexigens TaxID=226010 RepID=UPI00040C9EE4|nr:SURF1 family protein [Aestuariibacter salexigens]
MSPTKNQNMNQGTSTRFRHFPIIATLVAFISVVILTSLGLWQLDRAEQKSARQAHIQRMASQRTQSVEIVAAKVKNSDIRDMPFYASLKPDTSKLLFLDNRTHKGRIGYEVLVPAQTNAGTLLVNLGWIEGTGRRDTLPLVSLASEPVVWQGIAAIPSTNAFIRETAQPGGAWPMVIQQIDLSFITQALNEPVLPFIMQLTDESPEGFIRQWQPVVMPAEKHIGYALQWFGLAIACLVVYLFAVKNRMRRYDSSK